MNDYGIDWSYNLLCSVQLAYAPSACLDLPVSLVNTVLTNSCWGNFAVLRLLRCDMVTCI